MALDLATIFGFLLVSGAALFVFLLAGRLVRPRKPNAVKGTTYECGEKPVGPAWFNFNNRFYVIALVFVVFDVEVVLTVPALVIFRRLVESGKGWLALLEVFGFLGVLLGVLIYAWAKGDLGWVRAIEPPTCAPFEVGSEEKKP